MRSMPKSPKIAFVTDKQDQNNCLTETTQLVDTEESRHQLKIQIKVQKQYNPHQEEEPDGITKLVVKVSQTFKDVNKQLDPYTKGQTIQYPPTSAFKVIKIAQVYKKFFDYIRGQVERYMILDGGWVYMVKKIKNDKFKVCSVSDLKLLQTLLLTMKQDKHFFLIDFSSGKSKTLNFENKTQWNLFLIKLNAEVQRLGLEIDNF